MRTALAFTAGLIVVALAVWALAGITDVSGYPDAAHAFEMTALAVGIAGGFVLLAAALMWAFIALYRRFRTGRSAGQLPPRRLHRSGASVATVPRAIHSRDVAELLATFEALKSKAQRIHKREQ